MISQSACETLGKQYLAQINKTPGRPLQVGSWSHVPKGCTVQGGGDWAIHYNTHSTGNVQPNGFLRLNPSMIIPTTTPATPAPVITATQLNQQLTDEYKQIWKNAGCTTQPTQEQINWGIKQTKEYAANDAKNAWALSTDDSRKTGCYGPDKTKWPGYVAPKPIITPQPIMTQTDCQALGKQYLEQVNKVSARPLQTGAWGFVPRGCSVQTVNNEWTLHYNTHETGANNNDFTTLSKDMIKPAPTPIPVQVRPTVPVISVVATSTSNQTPASTALPIQIPTKVPEPPKTPATINPPVPGQNNTLDFENCKGIASQYLLLIGKTAPQMSQVSQTNIPANCSINTNDWSVYYNTQKTGNIPNANYKTLTKEYIDSELQRITKPSQCKTVADRSIIGWSRDKEQKLIPDIKNVVMSSIVNNFGPQNLFDGKLSTYILTGNSGVLNINLGKNHMISRLIIHNRFDRNQTYINGARLDIYNEAGYLVSSRVIDSASIIISTTVQSIGSRIIITAPEGIPINISGLDILVI